MSIGGWVTGTMGLTGDYPTVDSVDLSQLSGDYSSLLSSYIQDYGTIWNAEEQFKPQYAELNTDLFNTAYDSTLDSSLAAMQSAMPSLTNLSNSLVSSAQEQLDAGASLDPALQAVTEQSIRAGQASRGLGRGPTDVLEESRALTSLGESLRSEREDYATNVANLTNSMWMTPAESTASTAGLVAVNSQPTLTSGSTTYDMLNTLYNSMSAAETTDVNTETAMLSGFNNAE